MSRILDVNDPDQRLVWPQAIVAEELDRRLGLAGTTRAEHGSAEALSRLLRSAFNGPTLAEQFEALGDLFLYGAGMNEAQLAWLRSLRADLDETVSAGGDRLYWTQRHSGTARFLDLAETAERFVNLVQRLDQEEGLFAEAFGVDCPDGIGDPIDTPSQQITDRIERIPPGLERWPPRKGVVKDWTPDDLFDLMEVFYDLASWPGTWSAHNFGGCVGHPGNFSRPLGRSLYGHEVNKLLARSNLGVRIATSGEDAGQIVIEAGGGLDERINDALVAAPAEQQDDVAHAIALFRSRTRSVAAMRSAIVALAGVVEDHRSMLKEQLLSNDEAALFEIVNKFDLRHRNADQRTDYDPAFLEWLCHWYLATIALIGKLIAKQTSPTR